MSTTINTLVDRRGGAYTAEELQDVLNRARRILADTSALLELEIERLFATEVDVSDDEQLKRIKGLITQTQKGVQQILDIEAFLNSLTGEIPEDYIRPPADMVEGGE